MTGKEVIAKLKAAGWLLNRIHGSHYIMGKDGQAVPVPVHGTSMSTFSIGRMAGARASPTNG